MSSSQHRRRASRKTVALVSAATVALGAGTLVALGTGANAADTNLTANSGFETGGLSHWSCSAGTGAVVTSPTHAGSYALEATPTASDTAQCSQDVSVQPSTAYTLSGWVQGQNAYLDE